MCMNQDADQQPAGAAESQSLWRAVMFRAARSRGFGIGEDSYDRGGYFARAIANPLGA
jgi:hypothetical protein